MKNIFKILLVMILSFSLSMVYASQEEIDNAKKATEEYCEEDKEKKGCIYDSNNILYTDSGTVRNENAAVSLTLSGRKLVRGYQAADANGNMVFAGCYKANVSNVDYWGDGDYYIFKVVKFSGSSCSTVASQNLTPQKLHQTLYPQKELNGNLAYLMANMMEIMV